MDNPPGDTLESASLILKDTLRALFEQMFKDTGEIDSGLEDIRETARGKFGAIEERLARESAARSEFRKRLKNLRERTRERFDAMEARLTQDSAAIEELEGGLTEVRDAVRRTSHALEKRPALDAGEKKVLDEALAEIHEKVREKLVGLEDRVQQDAVALKDRLQKIVRSQFKLLRIPTEERILAMVRREAENAAPSQEELESQIAEQLEAFRESFRLLEDGLEKRVDKALEKALKKPLAREREALEKHFQGGLDAIRKEIESSREKAETVERTQQVEERLQEALENVDRVEKEAAAIQEILTQVQQVMEKIEKRIGSLGEVESLQKLVEEYATRVSEEVSQESLAGFLGALQDRVEAGLETRLTEFMDSAHVKDTLKEVTREVLPAALEGAEKDVKGLVDGTVPSPGVIQGILKSKEFAELLDSRFKLVNNYLKTDLVPKTVSKMLKKGGKGR
ncbi:MAG: hypothetical protein ACYTHM_00785 [Planctomycetota bacterium]|jgi:chromosome segregation ATPase